MCGIVGYTGVLNVKKILISGLERLEYRGYDSAGISVFDENSQLVTHKTMGRIENLKNVTDGKVETATCGIGHTRWATHGIPSDVNAHPHSTEKLSLVHNGIIENYLEIKSFLMENGYTFQSQTDTEIATKLFDYYYHGDAVKAIADTVEKLEGAYAFAIMFSDRVGEIFAIRKESPLVVTKSDDGLFLASDMPAVLEYTNKYFTIEQGEVAHLRPEGEKFYKLDGTEISKEVKISHLTFEQAEKGGFPHFMLKEIHDQPSSLEKTVFPRISEKNLPDFRSDLIDDSFFSSFNHIYVVACGTAFYAGDLGGQIMRQFAKVNVTSVIASEFRYNPPIFNEKDLVIVLSQSGETADTLAALKLARENKVANLAMVNVKGSAIALEADNVLYTHAGPEIAVASTKAFTVQVGLFYLFAIKTAMARNVISEAEAVVLTNELIETISEFKTVFELNEQCLEVSKTFTDAHSMFYIGRGLDSSLSQEAALKLKEISYIHSEAYAAGELKHGTISLITEETPVIALVTDGRLAPKTISNMKEVKARGGKITAIVLDGVEMPEDSYDEKIVVKAKYPRFAALKSIVPLQLLAYHTSVLKGCDVDKPRNLAKSVTVE